MGAALPGFYLGGAVAAFSYRQRAANAAHDHAPLSSAPAPTAAMRLMVFAPHCDDEVLGCAGLMQQTLAAGGAVQSVIFTNGDGFRTAVERQTRSLRVEPKDYIQFAALRQDESYRALENLGVKRSDVLFLGYPDRGLMPLWNEHWRPDNLYTSAYTRCDRSPYANTFDPDARYCGRDVIADIRAALRAFRPTRITVTHPADDHPDHAAAAAFVTRALQEAQADPRDADWAKTARIHYYLVHRGDWPAPQGMHMEDGLFPPAAMSYLDTRWLSRPLSPEEAGRKARSIELYASQTALMRRFLTSFARRSELFGELPPSRLPVVPDNALAVDGRVKDWERLPPVLLDPVRDNVLRDLQGGGDIRALYVCRDSRFLYVRLDTRLPVTRRMTYKLRLRPFSAHGKTGGAALRIPLRPANSEPGAPTGVRITTKNRTIEAGIPWQNVVEGLAGEPLASLAISAETAIAGVEVDKTGIRFLNP